MAQISIGTYDCLTDPSYRSAQGSLGIDDAFSIPWEEYFDNVKKHPSGLFLMIRHEELGMVIHPNGNYTVTKAEDDKEIYHFMDKVDNIIKKHRGV